ncbi:MAG: 5-oxoprolinase subunit PxpB [Negativicutes bacterium]
MENMKFLFQGETGLVVEFGNKIDPVVNTRVHTLSRHIEKECGRLIEAVVPTYRSLLVYFDPTQIKRQTLVDNIRKIAAEFQEDAVETTAAQIVRIPTLYGGEAGPDLEFVASHNQMSVEEVIRVHTSVPYRIYMIGFTPGFPYLGGMSEKIAAPRLKTPRTCIPGGSVGIAGTQTGLYPVESPGGWQLIGRTPLKVFDPSNEHPFLYSAGDYLQFEAITTAEYARILDEVQQGRFRPQTLAIKEGIQ